MLSEITQDSQCQLSALLRYFRHGDFNKFRRATDLVLGTEASSHPYFAANLLLAYQVVGLCETSNAAGLTEWWVSHNDDVQIRSHAPKQIGVSKQWFAGKTGHVVPLVIDAEGAPLVLGCRGVEGRAADQQSIFDRPICEFVPAFREVERQLCVEVPMSEGLTEGAEIYNCARRRWESVPESVRMDFSLSRVRKRYSGFTYFISHNSIGVRFQITQPEWAFVAAYHVLPWKMSHLFKTDAGSVCINRTMRLPILMLRALFAGCDSLRIGHEIVFENVRPECSRSLVTYFNDAGDRE